MKDSTLIGLPLVMLLGSFGPTWHLVDISFTVSQKTSPTFLSITRESIDELL